MNQFVSQQISGVDSARTWNNAISHASSGSAILDYFYKAGSFRNRSQSEVNADMSSIFAEDSALAMKIMLYNRMVTRQIRGFESTEKVQKGQGNKDEFIKSLAWLELNHPELLYKNLWLIPTIGKWSDLWYDSPVTGVNNYVSTKQVYKLIKHGLKDEYNRALLAKYLPKIRSAKNTTNARHRRLNDFARGLCKYLGWTERDYRQFKSSPENSAHLWQRYMCAGEWNSINFNAIPGKALFNLMAKKGKDSKTAIERHGLIDAYTNWIMSKPVAKFTGYPYELYKAAKSRKNAAETHTYNKQFEGLIEKATKDVAPEILEKGVLCALDTSGSMSISYGNNGQNGFAPIDVCVGLGIYFSKLLKGAFADNVVMFDNTSHWLRLTGDFCKRVDQISKHATALGGTNFQSVIDLIVNTRKSRPNIPVEDYPRILLVVSDMQYNATGTLESNYQMLKRKLQSVGLPEMKLIFWQVNGRFVQDVPVNMDEPGITLLSGFDGSIITNILGTKEYVTDSKTGERRKLTPYEQMIAILDQEVLNQIKV